jgi:hypothetical protein
MGRKEVVVMPKLVAANTLELVQMCYGEASTISAYSARIIPESLNLFMPFKC